MGYLSPGTLAEIAGLASAVSQKAFAASIGGGGENSLTGDVERHIRDMAFKAGFVLMTPDQWRVLSQAKLTAPGMPGAVEGVPV